MNNLYEIVLYTHSWFRWIILVLGIVVIARSIYGWTKESVYTKQDNLMSLALISVFHLQLVLGLLLYLVLSPLSAAAFSNMAEAMKNDMLRYWMVEHVFIMILSVAIAQIGRIKSKKSATDKGKFQNAAVYYLLAFILILTRIPWQDSYRMFRGLVE